MLIGTHVETSYSVVGRDGLQHLEPGQFYNGKKIHQNSLMLINESKVAMNFDYVGSG